MLNAVLRRTNFLEVQHWTEPNSPCWSPLTLPNLYAWLHLIPSVMDITLIRRRICHSHCRLHAGFNSCFVCAGCHQRMGLKLWRTAELLELVWGLRVALHVAARSYLTHYLLRSVSMSDVSPSSKMLIVTRSTSPAVLPGLACQTARHTGHTVGQLLCAHLVPWFIMKRAPQVNFDCDDGDICRPNKWMES